MFIREKIYLLGKGIGYLKLANQIENLGLAFKPLTVDGRTLKYKNFTCPVSLDFKGKDILIETVINYSRNRGGTIAEKTIIEQKIADIYENEYDLFQLINGHDLCNFLYIQALSGF